MERNSPHDDTNLFDEIEPNLWLGGLSAANDLKILNEKHIYHILTIDIQPLPIKLYNKENMVLKYIKANDTPNDDLITHFEETYDFIKNGLEKNGVLVHCCFGISRSATIVIAYLMKKNKWTLDYAYEHTRSKRESIKPNSGFMAQLSLFENMTCCLNRNNIQYKMFKLNVTAFHVRKHKKVPTAFSDVIKIDPFLSVAKTNPRVLKCKKCRRILADASNIIPHFPKEKYSWKNRRWSKVIELEYICCDAYFIEPLTWMENVSCFLEGKLYCPNSNCRIKLGSFNWNIGCQCPCGTKVCPGFYLIPSKIDRGII